MRFLRRQDKVPQECSKTCRNCGAIGVFLLVNGERSENEGSLNHFL